MTFKSFIHRYLATVLFALCFLCAMVSFLLPSSSLDTDGMASHVSYRLEKRMARLDACVSQLAASPAENGVWPRLDILESDMVIYRYCADTLHSWYNVLSVSPVPDQLDESPRYHKYGRRWYLVRLQEKGGDKFLSALEIRDDNRNNVTKGQSGINPRIHIHGAYDIVPADSQEGAGVKVGNTLVFNIIQSNSSTADNPLMANSLRWIAVLLFILAGFAYLATHRSVPVCLGLLGVLFALALLTRAWSVYLADYGQIFSPTLYAHDGILNSFGVLLVFNLTIFLSYLAMFMCRDVLAERFSSQRSSAIYVASLVVLLLASTVYLFYTLSTIVLNSSITLELFRYNPNSSYTIITYLSYISLSVSLLLLCETILVAVARVKGREYSVLTRVPVLVFSLLSAAGILLTVTLLGFKKEESRVTGWSNRIAVDRNLAMEMSLRSVENDIAQDQALSVLCHYENCEQLVMRRLEDCLGTIQRQASISVKVVQGINDTMRRYMEELLAGGISISPDSHFIYNRNADKGNYYSGVFSYYSEDKGQANLIIEVIPNSSDNLFLPRSYSYARYEDGKLLSLSGNFAYPTVLHGLLGDFSRNRGSFIYKGYRHFVNKINDDEVIVISRREEGMFTYFVTLVYLTFVIMLFAFLFRHRQRRQRNSNSRFSTRMLTLIIVSLVVTLISMAAVSVIFVYDRNERNMNTTMSAKISTIQLALDGVCRQYASVEDLQTQDFMRALDEVSRNTASALDVYSPSGTLVISTTQSTRRFLEMRSLISPEAYRNICLDHQRYYIEINPGSYRNYYILYAPVMNARGQIVGIVSTPYFQRDYDFERDAVFHAAAVMCLFLILLFITVLIASSIVRSIFHPLVAMGDKMSSVDAENLECIEYDGDDEISSLVSSYNKMVHDLKESTGKLAAAERDKAWSEMARQVAHEIKNPLTPIKLEIQRLQRLKMKNDPNWESKFDSVSAVVLEHIDILTQTANEFSTFAKLYSEPSIDIDLDKTLKEQIMLFDNRGVDITYLGVEDVHVMGPKPQLIRVFVNLLTNAMQAVEAVPSPKVMVSLRKGREGYWDIVFEDNGPGVSEENQSRLFTPNFTTKSSGTGLGLAICRSIVDRCDGSISYSRSFTLGGACFTVSIPA